MHNLGLSQKKNTFVESSDKYGHFLFKKDYIRAKKGGLNYLNKELVVRQRKVLSNLIKRMGMNLVSGKSIMSISLPVEIFSPHSFLERFAKSFGYAPAMFGKAGESKDPVEQMKYTVVFFIAMNLMHI